MTANIIPFTFNTTAVRIVTIDDQVWFVASDIAKALNYPEAKDMTRVLDEDERGRHIVPTPSGEQEMVIINESGLYHALVKSRKPEAKRFRKWVTGEVLPSIRKTGAYVATRHTDNGAQASAETLLPSEQQTLKEVAHKRVAALPAELHGRALAEIWSRLQNKFRVARYSQLPRHQLADAIAYVMTLELHCAPAAAAAPKPAPDARERISSRDLAAIQSVIAFIAHKMHYPGSWTQGLWRYLRTVLDNPAPNPFYVDQLPIIERTLGEVIALVIQLRDAEGRAEEKALRHLLGRHPQPLAVTLAELAAEVDAELSRARELKLDPPPYARLHLEAITDRMRPILRSLVMGGAERAAVAA